MVDWWQKMVFPVKRALVAVATRVKSRKSGGGLRKLHNDVQTCGYEDVQVMWEMLRRSEMELEMLSPTKRKRPFWRVFVFSSSHHPHHHRPTEAARSNLA